MLMNVNNCYYLAKVRFLSPSHVMFSEIFKSLLHFELKRKYMCLNGSGGLSVDRQPPLSRF